jgi:DNA recombination-dependent growth factor C
MKENPMWFKAAILYRIHQPPQLAADALASALEEHLSRPLEGNNPKRMGWGVIRSARRSLPRAER